MARPEKNRRVSKPPKMRGFKPFGIPKCKLEVVQLTMEEYESIRLVNYEMLQQKEAAVLMNISISIRAINSRFCWRSFLNSHLF